MALKTLLLLSSALLVASQSRPTIVCKTQTHNPGFCVIEKIEIPDDTVGYELVVPEEMTIRHVTIYDSKFPVITNDFCKKFPRLFSFQAKNQGVKRLAPDAFRDCTELDLLYLDDNDIAVLPPDVFFNASELTEFEIRHNRIQSLYENTFQHSRNVVNALFGGNSLTYIAPSVFKETWQLRVLYFESNDVTDVDEGGLLRTLRALKHINFQDNLIPCSRIPVLVTAFQQQGVTLSTHYETLKERSVEMDFVDGFRCVKGI